MNIKNIYISVSDSLRFDYTPHSIFNLGLSFKCVAPATFSHPSFSSLVTGVYPETHGVWNKLFDKITGPTLFDLRMFNTGYWADSPYDSLYVIFKKPNRIHLKDIKEPFILLERALETHIPYGSKFNSVAEFYKEVGDDYGEIIKYYKLGIEESLNKFFDRLNILEKRKLIENTLIIFTSDHGELFNEYNRPGHQLPLSPELVFVPLVFINPLFKRKFVRDSLVSLMDILPTILDVLGIYKRNLFFDGCTIFKRKLKYQFSSCRSFNPSSIIKLKILNSSLYNAHSIWDYRGNGIVILEGTVKRLFGAILDTIYTVKNQTNNWKKEKHFGNPQDEMKEEIKRFINNLRRRHVRQLKWKMNKFLFRALT